MDMIYEIRRRHLVQKQTITEISRDMGISRPTVRKHLATVEEPKYERVQPSSPNLGQFEEQLTKWLEEEAKLARPRRRTAHRLFEGKTPFQQEMQTKKSADSPRFFVIRFLLGSAHAMMPADTSALSPNLPLTVHSHDAPASRCCVPGSKVSTAHRPSFSL